MSSPGPPLDRLWRARRRHDHIDAALRPLDGGCELLYLRNDRLMLTWRFASPDDARAEAARRLQDLQRAGWVDHW